jgi:N-acyl-D-aspartate/D-glutamate deacylase
MRNPQRRERILHDCAQAADQSLFARFSVMYEMDDNPDYEPRPDDSIAARAVRVGIDPVAMAYDILVDGTGVIYLPAANYRDNSIEPILTMLAHEATTFGLGDGGAHCGMICDASLPTYYLSRWIGPEGGDDGRMPVEALIRKLTMDTADLVGLGDRGQIAPGLRADLNVIDLDNVALMKPEAVGDLPEGAKRIGQRARGYVATIVAGEITYRDGEPTGALPGRLVRGARARASA